MRGLTFRLYALLVTIAVAAPAAAQSPSLSTGIDAQLFRPAGGRLNLFSQETARTPEPWSMSLGLMFNYQRNPLVLRREGTLVERTVSNQGTANLLFTLGLTNFLEAGLDLPLHLRIQGEGGAIIGGTSVSSTDIGDIRLNLKWRLLGNGSGFGLAIATPVTFPSGRGEGFRGDASVTFSPRVILDYQWSRVGLTTQAGYFFRKRTDFGSLSFDDEIFYGAGVGVSLWRAPWNEGPLRDRLVLIGELFGRTSAVKPFENLNQNGIEGLGGLRYTHPKTNIAVSLGVGTGLQPGYGVPSFRVFASLQWIPGPKPERPIEPSRPAPPPPEPPAIEPLPRTPTVEALPVLAIPTVPGPEEEMSGPPPWLARPQALVLRLKKVYFRFNKWVPRRISHPPLNSLHALLSKYPEVRIRVEGHTDNIGSARYNKWLSQKRAEAVRRYLIGKGIAASRVVAAGFGEERPLASNKKLGGRRMNRRVEVHFLTQPKNMRIKIQDVRF